MADADIEGALNRLGAEQAKFLTKYARLREALIKIADFDDKQANAHLEATGSFGGFDEPGSVKIAREILKELKGL